MGRRSVFCMEACWVIVVGSVALAQVLGPPAVHGVGGSTQALSSKSWGWMQVNDDGFGDPANVGVTALEVFEGRLYAGASNWEAAGRVWRSEDGVSWLHASEIGSQSPYTGTNPAIIDLIEFEGQLYAGTGWGDGSGQIWRSPDGASWEQVEGNGFGDAHNLSITTFTLFGDTLYAATENIAAGCQIWRSDTGDPLSWTNVVTAGLGYGTNRQITGLALFGGALYAATETVGPGAQMQVWRTPDGIAWTPVIADGFGDPDNYSAGGFALFGGDLYLGTRNDVTGAQLWRSDDGTTWTQVLGDGLGDPGNVKVESLSVFEGYLVLVTNNEASGMEVWCSSDGATWDQVSSDGFGDPANFATLWSNATVTYRDRLFVGTWRYGHASGAEVWMTADQVFLPLVLRD